MGLNASERALFPHGLKSLRRPKLGFSESLFEPFEPFKRASLDSELLSDFIKVFDSKTLAISRLSL